MNNKLPSQLNTYIKDYVYTGQQSDIEQIIFAIENLISRNKKFVLTFDQGEEFTFSFLPKRITLSNKILDTTKIDLFFDSSDADAVSIQSYVFPFQDRSDEEIKEQKKWIVFFIYDLIQQFGIDLEWDSNKKILRTSNAYLTRKAFAQLLKSCRTASKENIPRWYVEYKKIVRFIRASEAL